MKRLVPIFAGLCLCASATPLWAQAMASQDQPTPPPKVLIIDREMVKFGRSAAHEKNEAAYVQAAMAGKDPTRYLAVTSISGPGEAWFLVGFDSFDAVEKAHKYFEGHAALQAKYDQIMEADAQFVNDGNSLVCYLNDKMSYHAAVNIPTMRYFDVETIRYREGHDAEWDELGKLIADTLDKAHLDMHFAFYDVVYGAQTGTVLIFTPHKSLGELDSVFSHDEPAFMDALGPNGKRFQELLANTIISDVTNVYAFNPKMSYPPDAFITADPAYWKPKAMTAAAPATGTGAKPAKAATPASKPGN
jgi:hypothetical protein